MLDFQMSSTMNAADGEAPDYDFLLRRGEAFFFGGSSCLPGIVTVIDGDKYKQAWSDAKIKSVVGLL